MPTICTYTLLQLLLLLLNHFRHTPTIFTYTLLQAALAFTGGHKQKAAALIGWGRNTVTRKLKELGEH